MAACSVRSSWDLVLVAVRMAVLFHAIVMSGSRLVSSQVCRAVWDVLKSVIAFMFCNLFVYRSVSLAVVCCSTVLAGYFVDNVRSEMRRG